MDREYGERYYRLPVLRAQPHCESEWKGGHRRFLRSCLPRRSCAPQSGRAFCGIHRLLPHALVSAPVHGSGGSCDELHRSGSGNDGRNGQWKRALHRSGAISRCPGTFSSYAGKSRRIARQGASVLLHRQLLQFPDPARAGFLHLITYLIIPPFVGTAFVDRAHRLLTAYCYENRNRLRAKVQNKNFR